MPVKTCLSSILSTRFDFGVPLEDIFPPNDIHPRLKYLFGKAYESYVNHERGIEVILRQGQGKGMMKERLKLKEKLVLDLDYHIHPEEFTPGTYFWVIRHFLGLLPLPLIPECTNGFQFDWRNLAYKCKNLLQNYGTEQKDRHEMDYEIAQTINMLPFENFVLLNILLAFVRKLSTKNIRGRHIFNKKSMWVLMKYYCSSIFARPFRPGYHQKNDSHLPLLLYLTLRWKKISKHCEAIGNPAFFLEYDIKNLERGKSFGQRDNCSQTNILGNAFFNPEVVSVCRNIPYFVNICNKYRDVGCQTVTDLCRERNGQSYCPIPEESEESIANLNNQDNNDVNGNNKAYKLAYIEEEPSNLLKNCGEENDNDNTLYQTATDFSFKSVSNKKEEDWQNIVKETMNTVRRVEESYIYDDYETFRKEEFNQIGKNRSRSFLSRISKYGFTYTPPKNSARQEVRKTSTPAKESPESDVSYVKYPDVCENINIEDCSVKYNQRQNREPTDIRTPHDRTMHKIKPPNHSVSQKLFQDDSSASIQADNSKQGLENGGSYKKKKKYLLKRIRLSFEFLRALTPKKSTFKRIESRVRYRRIKNGKSNTI